MSQNKSFRKFQKRGPVLTTEQKIEKFILRNSKSGFFTKFSTIPYKFEISNDQAWNIIGDLLADGKIESSHDLNTGEMKLCEIDKMYEILNSENSRKMKFKKSEKNFKKKVN